MQIKLNGEKENLEKKISIKDFLKEKKMLENEVVIEHNKEIIKNINYETQFLKNGDSLEILSFVGGG